MRTRRWIVGALLLAGCAHSPTPASAQDVAEGTRIRVRLDGERGWTKGTFAGMHDGVLVLADQEGAPERTFNVSEIDRIQRHAGSKYGKGALIGAGVGFLAGALLVAGSCGDTIECSGAWIGFGGLTFGAIGGLVGLAAGAFTTRWADIDMGVHAYFDPLGRRFGIAMDAPW